MQAKRNAERWNEVKMLSSIHNFRSSVSFFIICVCAMFILISCTQGDSQQSSISPSPTTQPTNAVSTPDSDWVEYHSETIGVSFKHPKGWIVSENEAGQLIRTGAGSHVRGMVYTLDRWDDVEGYDAVFLLEFAKDYMVTEIWRNTDSVVQIADMREFEVEGNSAASTIYRRASGDEGSRTEYYYTAITNGDSAVIVLGLIIERLVDDEPETYRKVVNSVRIFPR